MSEPGRSNGAKSLSVGWPAPALGVWTVLHWAAVLGTAYPLMSLGWASGEVAPSWGPTAILVPSASVGLIFAVLTLVRLRHLASGTTGRARLMVLAWSTIVRALTFGTLAAVLGVALTDPNALALGLGLEDSLMPVGSVPMLWESIALVTTAQGTYVLLIAAAAVDAVALVLQLGAAAAAWFLVPPGVRRAVWYVADAILLIAVVAVTLLLPIQPPAEGGDVTLPAIRLSITTLFSLRALYYAVPFFLDILEGNIGIRFFGLKLPIPLLGNFRLVVASRLLRAKKSGFLTAIGALSILAVSFSSCTLTTTLSVMGGFRNDLKRKILGNNAHVVLDREHGTFEGWSPTLDSVRAQPDVVAATPYVQGEVMITSATNLAGAVIRGIDPDSIGDVTDLPRNLRHGRMEYLSQPERLLRLRADEMRRGLLSPRDFEEGLVAPPPLEGERGSLFDEVERTLDEVERPADPDTERIDAEIEEFLREGSEAGAEPAAEPAVAATDPPGADPGGEEDVLPGLIVGQELARTLRLHVGDEVNVVSPLGDLGPSGPMPKTRPFRVAGIFYSGMYEFDMKMAYTTLEAAQRFLGVGDAISGIEVKVEDTDQAEPIARGIAGAIERPDLRVRAWQEVNRNLFGALQLEKLAMFITLGIAILVASFCIIGTLTLMVQEKGKEVGILKAMGATGEQIVAVFMAQGLMIGVLGAATGLGLGYVACFVMEHFGIHLNPEVYYIDKLPVHIDPAEFVWTGVASVVVCLLATIYPAILGSRLRPVDALRYS